MQDVLLPVLGAPASPSLGDFQSWATSKQLSKRTPPPVGDGRNRWHRGCAGLCPSKTLTVTVPCAPGEATDWGMVLHCPHPSQAATPLLPC